MSSKNPIGIGSTAWSAWALRVASVSRENSAGVTAIQDNVELKLADKLALERTVLAADRSLLAGVRTSLNFIGFGFAIYQVLRYLQENSAVTFMRPQTPRNFGMFMLLAGTVPLFVMMIQYYKTMKRIGTKASVVSNPYFQMAFAAVLLGTVLLTTFTLNILMQ